jgi:short-subunit dehydrogenase
VRIRGSVVVVTGASSGIGRATALRLVAKGATVVGVARDAHALRELERAHGVHAAPADVADPEAVRAVAATTVSRHGRLDGWVNAAGVITFGRFLDVPLAEQRRVLDVDLFGAVHGCRAALPPMLDQGRGVIVNVASILGILPLPYGSAYTMAKFALRGLSGSLRHELRGSGVRVATVLPAAVDTPIWHDAGNHLGRAPRLTPPTYTPERVARTIVRQLGRPRREVVVGGVLARALVWQHRLTPGLAERVLAEEVARYGVTGPPTSAGPGAVHDPPAGARAVHGGWHGRARQARRTAAGLAALAGAGIWWTRRMGER